jgi:hypothetical protein
MKKMAGIPAVAKMIGEAKEVVNWFTKHKIQRSIYEKLSPTRNLVTPGDTRYVGNFLMLFRLLERRNHLQRIVTSDAYISKEFMDDFIKNRVLDIQWWNLLVLICNCAMPLTFLLKLVDSKMPVSSSSE